MLFVTLTSALQKALRVAYRPIERKRKLAKLDTRICLGCGVCVRACRKGAVRMASRPARVITPVNSVQRVVLMAVERGKIQNLIFENRAHRSHRAMAAILGAILRLPPAKKLLARALLNSRFLDLMLKLHEPVRTAGGFGREALP